jgi:hypothetical protein
MNNDNHIMSIVEDGFNATYIDSLLIALFYNNNKYLLEILNLNPIKPAGIYLQELIKQKFVEPLQRNFSISSSTINEIRNYSKICGFEIDDITKEQNIINYFKFIAELFNIDKIGFELEQIKDNSNIINKNILSIGHLTFKPQSDTTIKILMEKWIDNNIFKNKEYHSNLYNIYSLSNIPTYIIIHINRDEDTENNKAKIDIMKRIKFYNGLDTQNYLKWNLQSIICYDKTYYTIVYNNKHSILFNNKYFPSFTQININDDEIKDKIMLKCVMLVYTLNDI